MSVLEAFLSSSEETMFGTLAEQCAVVICQHTKNGMKSTAEGIDIEYVEDETRTIIQVKSGKNWGNSSQRKKLSDYFNKATRILQQGNNAHIRCIEGICYGPTSSRNRGSYYTYIGSAFWEEISGWGDTHIALLSIFSTHAQNGLMESKALAKDAVIQFLVESGISQQGEIDWVNLVNYVNKSGEKMNKDQPKKRQITPPHSDYSPSKAEKEKEYAMPGADVGTIHRAFFQPTDIRHKAKGKEAR